MTAATMWSFLGDFVGAGKEHPLGDWSWSITVFGSRVALEPSASWFCRYHLYHADMSNIFVSNMRGVFCVSLREAPRITQSTRCLQYNLLPATNTRCLTFELRYDK